MDTNPLKNQLGKLITKYENLGPIWRKKYNEANTRKNFILPLFEILGWDTRGEDVSEEERASGKRVDYAFKINGITRFFLEAKPFSVNLNESRWAEQAIWYAYHKSVPWVVLTDFESIKVFNAEWDEQDIERSLVFEIPYKDYLTNDKLWLLSRPSIEKGELDEYAEKEFKKPKRVAVDKQLVADLLRWRDKFYDDFSGYNPLIDKKKIAENVQKVLNRIIFIRACEDRGFEERSLQEMVRNWEEGRGKSDELVNGLRVLFREFDKNYDSKLFEEKILFESEKFVVDDNTLAKVIKETYKGSKGIRWNFNDINGDVLGSIYEQYLGQIQAGESEKKSTKRKSQGIYYTPRYIVDYIVKNTLGEALKGKTFNEILKLKVLDPACGSGSFLIRAFEEALSYLRKETGKINRNFDDYALRWSVLTSMIYGVDLDQEAVEIAQLNLLLKTLGRREKLPNLSNKIECGNSLISGTETELKKYFGKNWKDKKPFNWEEKFPDVFKKDGFDVIIGNPPYIGSLELSSGQVKEKEFFRNKYAVATGNFDIYVLFLEKAINLTKENGLIAFIIPNKFLVSDYGIGIRKMLLKYKIIEILDLSNLPVFHGVAVYPIIIILKKEILKEDLKVKIGYVNNEQFKILYKITNQLDWGRDKKKTISLHISTDIQQVLNKIEIKSVKLGEIANVVSGTTGFDYMAYGKLISEKKNNQYIKFVITRNIEPYYVNWGKKINYLKKSFTAPYFDVENKNVSAGRKSLYKNKNKILLRGMSKKLIAGIDQEGYALGVGVYAIIDSEYDNYYLSALLNSKLIDFYYKSKFQSKHLAGGYIAYNVGQIKQVSIYKINFSNKTEKLKTDELVKLADKMLKLNKDLQKLDPFLNKDEYKELKSEIDKTDKEIDEKVYKLYGLTPGEIKIVEKNYA